MFEHVLVPLDESALAEQILPHVALVAAIGDPRVSLVRVMESPTSAGVDQPTDPVDWQLALDRAHSYLADVVRRLADAGVSADAAVIEGDPATAVLHLARERGVDLLALTTHGRGGVVGHTLGSVAGKTVTRARTNLLLVRSFASGSVSGPASGSAPDAQPRPNSLTALYDRVLVPLDGSLRAEAAVPLAARIGSQAGATLTFAHVVTPHAAIRGDLPHDGEAERRDGYRAAQRRSAETYLDRLARDHGGNGMLVTSAVVTGDTAAAIEELAAGSGHSLTVLAAHGESGSTRTPYGSVALHALVYGGGTLLVVQDRRLEELVETHSERAARERQGHG